MKIKLLTLILSYITISCAGAEGDLRTTQLQEEGLVLSTTDDNAYSFDLAVPQDSDAMVGVKSPSINIPKIWKSEHIEYLCRDRSMAKTTVAITLLDHSAGKKHAHVSRACQSAAKVRLLDLDRDHKYSLYVSILNSSGVLFNGRSGVFTTATRRLAIKMNRVKKADVDVDIIFPKEDPPAQEYAAVRCYAGESFIKPSGDAEGNLANDIIRPGPAVSCSAEELYPAKQDPDKPVAIAFNQCGATGHCTLKLKAGVAYRVKMKSSCGQEERIFKLRGGQKVDFKACQKPASTEAKIVCSAGPSFTRNGDVLTPGPKVSCTVTRDVVYTTYSKDEGDDRVAPPAPIPPAFACAGTGKCEIKLKIPNNAAVRYKVHAKADCGEVEKTVILKAGASTLVDVCPKD